MTNHWIDIVNADCIFIIGSNPAENHPISFKWVLRAKDRGATVIHAAVLSLLLWLVTLRGGSQSVGKDGHSPR